jgi:hypothetical protein
VLGEVSGRCAFAGDGDRADDSPDHQSIDAAALISGACLVMLFGLDWVGWLPREHQLWREGRPQPDRSPG